MPAEPPQNETDEDLVRRVAEDRDERALEILMSRYAPKALGYLKKKFGKVLPEPELDQVFNDAVFNVWKSACNFDPERSFASWFFQILQNAALDILKVEKEHNVPGLQTDPADPCEDDGSARDPLAISRLLMMEDIIENELIGFEQIVAKADAIAGGSSDSKQLATLHGKSLNTVYATRTKVREKIRNRILERETHEHQRKVNK